METKMTDVTYKIGDTEIGIKYKTVQITELNGIRHEIIGGVTPNIDYEIAQETDDYEGHTFHPVFVKPGNINHDVDLEQIAKPDVQVGDRLVARVLNGNEVGKIILLPGRITKIINNNLIDYQNLVDKIYP